MNAADHSFRGLRQMALLISSLLPAENYTLFIQKIITYRLVRFVTKKQCAVAHCFLWQTDCYTNTSGTGKRSHSSCT